MLSLVTSAFLTDTPSNICIRALPVKHIRQKESSTTWVYSHHFLGLLHWCSPWRQEHQLTLALRRALQNSLVNTFVYLGNNLLVLLDSRELTSRKAYFPFLRQLSISVFILEDQCSVCHCSITCPLALLLNYRLFLGSHPHSDTPASLKCLQVWASEDNLIIQQ